jgi:LmbE family N-acetylglucosaminyl deacetylase
MATRVIAIGAHPDDIEIGCGGTVCQFAQNGAEVYFLIATLGEECLIEGEQFSTLIERRKKESISAANFLGTREVYFLNLQDTQIQHDGKTVKAIEKCVKVIEPDFIFTHTKEDEHQDHKNIAFATISACRRRKINILHYESPSTSRSFSPTVFSDISNTIEAKIRALQLFESQNAKTYVDPSAIKGLSQYRGYISGSKYAEAFEVSKYYLNLSSRLRSEV